MTTYTVTTTFALGNRRFRPGQMLTADDLAGPVEPRTWVELGYIEVLVMAPRGMEAGNDVE